VPRVGQFIARLVMLPRAWVEAFAFATVIVTAAYYGMYCLSGSPPFRNNRIFISGLFVVGSLFVQYILSLLRRNANVRHLAQLMRDFDISNCDLTELSQNLRLRAALGEPKAQRLFANAKRVMKARGIYFDQSDRDR
jgi:hypothetical protein